MPLTRYQIRNEYGLADPELYGAADRDDPEALLEGVAMAGLVGVLRQLGDLAEFAAEIFHDLHEEVMGTATRGHGLVVRVQQLEADFPSIEKALLSQTNHSSFFSNPGVDWHPNLRSEQNMITRGDLPRFVMDSYEECRGPPRLFLLDKFDVAGAGACLKRYTDPSFFKVESASSITVEMQREKKTRKVKQKKGSRWRNGETPEVALTSHAKSNAKLHELFLEERIENRSSDPVCRVKLKKRHLNGSAVDSKTGKSYMKTFLETLSPEHKLICETSVAPPLLRLTLDDSGEPDLRILDITTVSPAEMSPEREIASFSPDVHKDILKPSIDGFNRGVFDREIPEGSDPNSDVETNENYSNLHQVAADMQLAVGGEHKTEGSMEGSTLSSYVERTSEVDNYMDALANIESEMEINNEFQPKNNLRFQNVEKYGIDSNADDGHLELQTRFSDSQSIGNSSTSDDGKNSFEKDTASFSHSDNPNNVVENSPSECNGAAKEFPFTETCGAEIFEMSSNQQSEFVDPLAATTKKHALSHNACIVEDINPDPGDTSYSSFVRDTSPTLQHSDPGANSPVVSLAGPVLDDTPSDEIKVGYKSLDIDENVTNLDNSLAVVPNSQTNDESPSTSPRHPVDESDIEALGVSSDALPHLSKVESLASEDQSGNIAVNEILQTQCADEDSLERFARKFDSPRLSISSTEEQLSSALPEEQTSSVNSEVVPFMVDAARNHSSEEPAVDAAQSHSSEEPVVDAPQTHGLIDQQDAWQAHFLTEQQDAPETCGLTKQQDASQTHGLTKQQDASQTHGLTEQQDVPQTNGLIEQQLSDLDEDVPQIESVKEEAGVPHYEEKFNVEERSRAMDDEELRLFTSHADVGGDIVSVELTSNCPTFPGHEDHVDSDEVVPETLNVETVAVPSAAVAEPDNDVNDVSYSSPNAISSSPTNFINLHGSLPGFGDFRDKESELDEVSPESVTDSEVQMEASKTDVSPDSESNSSQTVTHDHSSPKASDDGQNFSLDEQIENSLAVCDVPAESNPSESTTYDHSSSKVFDDGHNFTLDELTESSLAVGDVTIDSASLENTEVVSSPTCYLPEPETSLENSLELQANQVDIKDLPTDGARDQPEADLKRSLQVQSAELDVESSEEDQASIILSSLQSVQAGSQNHMDLEKPNQLPSTEHINQEVCWDASPESHPEYLPSQALTSEFLPESSGQELLVTKQTLESLDSTLPRSVLPPEATVVNLEDMPPLPPLPPMQWRMGKQHASLFSQRELVGVGQDSLLPIQPPESDEKAQFDMPAPQREVLPPQNPFLPLTSEEGEKFQHVSEPVMGNVVHPALYSLHLPAMVNDANHQYNLPDLGGAQFSNSFLSLPEASHDGSGSNHLASEEEKVKTGSNPFTGPSSECITFTHDPESSHGSIIQPVQQVTPETGIEPKILQHSLKNSESELGEPLSTSVTAPPMVEQPQHSLPTSEGEIAWSSHNSAVMSDYEGGRSNGVPVSKLPRPRNPLIDAVAAHGQSKLRKVTERVRPQVEPKVDERDSMLQQIRTKSFNLKPAMMTRSSTVTRPSIQGPATNLRVAAILEKANAIRQAHAGSDEDDDDDSWSDT
ncbi:protein SCAR2-like isoform X1 [Malus domestica]|uniref:protein SCAR2-like isoform X1 n=1 Tax=Malus domestica TaxID=3750 RepID=UPI0010A9D916|nr:protein SCAR2-like isoform X1 [Malus domestica]